MVTTTNYIDAEQLALLIEKIETKYSHVKPIIINTVTRVSEFKSPENARYVITYEFKQ